MQLHKFIVVVTVLFVTSTLLYCYFQGPKVRLLETVLDSSWFESPGFAIKFYISTQH